MAVVAIAIAGGIVGIACGLDDAGTREAIGPGADTSTPTEAAPIPRPDGSLPEAGEDAEASIPTGCPTTNGRMVLVNAGGLSFCIDATEVTNGEYDKFVTATAGSPDAGVLDASVPVGCQANLTLAPTSAAVDAGAYPATNIDWCDAHAFCAWAGKRLCGKIVNRDASTGEWFNACSNGGTRPVPYGPAYVAGRCKDNGGTGPDPVGSHPGCEGGLPGIYDMNGNVAEYVDSCGATTCAAMGGDYGQPGSCVVAGEYARTVSDPAIGFRCCADPK